MCILVITVISAAIVNIGQDITINLLKNKITCLERGMVFIGNDFCAPTQ